MKLASALYGSFYPFDELAYAGKPLFTEFYTAVKPDDLQTDSCLVVWGGEDISPSLYNKAVGSYTRAGEGPSKRDASEWALMQRAKEMNLPIIGVCRGAQMLCALAGGFLVQDVTGHGRSHDVETKDGSTFSVSSLHHQMLYPFGVDHVMLAWSERNLSRHYMVVDDNGKDKSISVPNEPEAVWFPKVKGFAPQFHPEFNEVGCAQNLWVAKQVHELILGEQENGN